VVLILKIKAKFGGGSINLRAQGIEQWIPNRIQLKIKKPTISIIYIISLAFFKPNMLGNVGLFLKK
jgi:hypothetical protein